MPRSKSRNKAKIKSKTPKYNKFHVILVAVFIIGVVLWVANSRPEDTTIATEREVNQYSDLFFTYTVVKYPTKVEVLRPTQLNETLSIGVNAGVNELDFGKVEAGGSVRKWINLTTNDGKPSKIVLKTKGTISPLVSFNKNSFLLVGNSDISVTMNAGSVPGNYTGEVAVYIERSNSDIQKQILGY